MTPDELHAHFLSLVDPAYKAFGDRLQPGVTDRLGVRTPLVRRTAAGILRTTGARAFLDAMLARGAFASQEALMTCEIVVGAAKDLTLEERLAYVDALLPYMTGWATCDLMGSAVKVFREKPAELLDYVASKLADENPWAVRVAEVWLLEHYRSPEWVPAALDLLEADGSRALPLAASGDYYLSMSLAWCLSMLAVGDLEAVCARMTRWREEGRLDDETLRRTVRKIRESFRFAPETKDAVSQRFAQSRAARSAGGPRRL